jgi:anti-sigma B factor antagonist
VELEVQTTPIGDGNAVLIAVDGELDLATCDRLKPAADDAVFGRRPLILDLSDCSFIDSTGLRLVLQISKALDDDDGPGVSMAIVGGDSNTRKMFTLTAIDQTIPLFDTRDEAIEWLDAQRKPNGEPDLLTGESPG